MVCIVSLPQCQKCAWSCVFVCMILESLQDSLLELSEKKTHTVMQINWTHDDHWHAMYDDPWHVVLWRNIFCCSRNTYPVFQSNRSHVCLCRHKSGLLPRASATASAKAAALCIWGLRDWRFHSNLSFGCVAVFVEIAEGMQRLVSLLCSTHDHQVSTSISLAQICQDD